MVAHQFLLSEQKAGSFLTCLLAPGDAPGTVQLTVGALHMCTECLMGWLQKMSLYVEQPKPSAHSGTFICVMLEQVRPLDDGSIIFIMTWAHLMIKKGDPSARSLYSVCPWRCVWLIKLPLLTPLSTRSLPPSPAPAVPLTAQPSLPTGICVQLLHWQQAFAQMSFSFCGYLCQ